MTDRRLNASTIARAKDGHLLTQ